VRLKTNLILPDAKFYSRGSVLDLDLVPEHLRDPDHIDRDLETREGGVLLLRDLNFSTIPAPDSDGVPTAYPVFVSRGELFDLNRLPESSRRSLKEGEDYRKNWTFAEAEKLRKEASDLYSEQLVAEPVIPTGRSR
jgi:hypothetical protein